MCLQGYFSSFLQSRHRGMEGGGRFGPDSLETFQAKFGRFRQAERRFAAHMVAVEAPHDVHPVADAERVGQVVQVAAGGAALDPVAVILQ